MAGESIRDYGSSVALEANGGSISAAAFAQANDANFSLSADGGNRPHLALEFEWTHGSAPTANSAIQIFAQDLDFFGGTNDALAPSANNLQRLVATILADASTSTQRRRIDVMFAPENAAYYVRNGSNQTISSGWKLSARAWTLKPA